MCSSREAPRRDAVVDGGDLHGGDDPHAEPLARRDRLGDPGDGVVVGERQQLHARLGGALHDLGGAERAVGVGRVRLQVEAGAREAAYAIALRSRRGADRVGRGGWASSHGAPGARRRVGRRLAQAAHGRVVAAGPREQRRRSSAGRAAIERRVGGVGLGGAPGGLEPQ